MDDNTAEIEHKILLFGWDGAVNALLHLGGNDMMDTAISSKEDLGKSLPEFQKERPPGTPNDNFESFLLHFWTALNDLD